MSGVVLRMTDIVDWRPATPEEIPGGAARIAKAAEKAGWEVRAGFCRGLWVGSEDDEAGDEPQEEQVVEMVTIQGRRGGQIFRANWRRKLWTKAGQDGYSFVAAMMSPPVAGPIASSKARKDWHPESLGDATIGGLKNSKTLSAYIKEEPPCSAT
jgi:hypothetical protein